MMLRGLWKLTWIEIKIFLREPLGAFGTIGFPVLIFLALGRALGRGQHAVVTRGNRVYPRRLASARIDSESRSALCCRWSRLFQSTAEGGILNATGEPRRLRPQTILAAHVIA